MSMWKSQVLMARSLLTKVVLNENGTILEEKLRSWTRKGKWTHACKELEGKGIGLVKLDESIVQLLRAREKYITFISFILII
jgi:hypothetical protein